ncbi:MAG: succinate dehydrogenase, hydrophobic membrane anchor protein [Pseudomonadota bacterium]
MVKRVVVGAHYGLRDWLMQRVTAAVMVAYTALFLAVLVAAPTLEYDFWKALFQNQWMRLATLMFLVSLYLHAWVGVRDILMDYVHPTAVRLMLEILVILALVFYTVWAAHLLWGV